MEKEKTIDELMKEFNNQPLQYLIVEKNRSDYRIEALRAATSLKHETVQELLTDADRIEKWLFDPIIEQERLKQESKRKQDEFMKKMMQETVKK